MQLNINALGPGTFFSPLWYRSCPKPTHASTNSLEESGQMSKILHCTSFKAKKFAVESDVNLRQHGLNVLHVFKKVLKSSYVTQCNLSCDHTTTTNKIECTRSQPININTTGICTQRFVHMHVCSMCADMTLNTSMHPHSQTSKYLAQTAKI